MRGRGPVGTTALGGALCCFFSGLPYYVERCLRRPDIIMFLQRPLDIFPHRQGQQSVPFFPGDVALVFEVPA